MAASAIVPAAGHSPFHLLEVTLISAQDLLPARRSMRTYAEAWVHPEHRLRTRLDDAGHTDPSWNDKFVFRVDDATLLSDTSTLTVDIYAADRGARSFLPGRSPALLGTARALLSTLRPGHSICFAAVQVRRPASLRPQGILNVGVSLLDAYARSMPLFAGLGSSAALAVRDEVAGGHKLARHGSVRLGGKTRAAEQELMDSKMEKWKAENGAIQEREGKGRKTTEGGMGRRRWSSGALSCFSGAGDDEEEFI